MSDELLFLNGADVREAAPIDDLIDWMRDAMRVTSSGDVELPLRREFALPEDLGKIGMMPGFVGGDVNRAGIKLVSLVPPHRRKGSSHLGLMILYDADGLQPLAILCGSTVTAIRTSAVSAVATDALARQNSKVLTILGSGEQALAHAKAVSRVRGFSELRVWNVRRAGAENFAKALSKEDGLMFEVFDDVSAAVAGADVVCAVTSAKEPFLLGSMIGPGMHVNLVGSSHRGASEADSSLVQKAEFFVDYIPSTLDQAGEFLTAINDGSVNENHIKGEVGEVLTGQVAGRSSDKAITVYKSLGVASQDIVTAQRVFERARKAGLGNAVSL